MLLQYLAATRPPAGDADAAAARETMRATADRQLAAGFKRLIGYEVK